MKKLTVAASGLALVLMTVAASVWAQTARDEVEVMLELAQLERKAIVAQNMQLTAEEAEVFWPIYNDYVTKLRDLSQRDVKLITTYAESYLTLTDEQATELLKEAQSIDQARLKTRIKYAKKLKHSRMGPLAA